MKTERQNKKVAIITLITFVAMVTVNALANIIPINGITTGEVSDNYENLFAPAGLTFAIWGVIYILLFMYTIYQLKLINPKDDNKENEDKIAYMGKISVLFSISSIANFIWIFMWHYDFILVSLIFMVIILLCLIVIHHIIRKKELSFMQKLFIRLPFSIYFGWITVATVANVTTYLVSIGWQGGSSYDYLWADLIILVAAVIGFVSVLYYKDIAYGLAIIWAYVGILNKHVSSSGFDGEYISVIITVGVSILLILFAQILTMNIGFRERKALKESHKEQSVL